MKTTKEIIESKYQDDIHEAYMIGLFIREELNEKWFSEEEIRKVVINFQSKKRQITDKILIQEELKEYLLKELGLEK